MEDLRSFIATKANYEQTLCKQGCVEIHGARPFKSGSHSFTQSTQTLIQLSQNCAATLTIQPKPLSEAGLFNGDLQQKTLSVRSETTQRPESVSAQPRKHKCGSAASRQRTM